MERQGKMESGVKKIWNSVSSFGRRSNTSSSASGGLLYKPLLDSDDDLPGKEPKAPTRSQNSLGRNLSVDIPKGHLPVYVGPERVRFIIRIEYLSLDFIKELMDLDEISSTHPPRGLTLDCEPALFKMMLEGVEKGLFDSKRRPTQ